MEIKIKLTTQLDCVEIDEHGPRFSLPEISLNMTDELGEEKYNIILNIYVGDNSELIKRSNPIVIEPYRRSLTVK